MLTFEIKGELSCDFCDKEIEKEHYEECEKCGAILCEEHRVYCKKCGLIVCPECSIGELCNNCYIIQKENSYGTKEK